MPWLRRLRFRWQRRARPIGAARSMRKVLANPDDTGEIFRVLRALSGNDVERGGRRDVGAMLDEASRRGREAVLLPAADWEALLERPLDEVRRLLRVGPPYASDRVDEPLPSPEGDAPAAAVG